MIFKGILWAWPFCNLSCQTLQLTSCQRLRTLFKNNFKKKFKSKYIAKLGKQNKQPWKNKWNKSLPYENDCFNSKYAKSKIVLS